MMGFYIRIATWIFLTVIVVFHKYNGSRGSSCFNIFIYAYNEISKCTEHNISSYGCQYIGVARRHKYTIVIWILCSDLRYNSTLIKSIRRNVHLKFLFVIGELFQKIIVPGVIYKLNLIIS